MQGQGGHIGGGRNGGGGGSGGIFFISSSIFSRKALAFSSRASFSVSLRLSNFFFSAASLDETEKEALESLLLCLIEVVELLL